MITLYTAAKKNLGDEVVLKGAIKALGLSNYRVVRQGETPDPLTERFIVVGTPWLWDQCALSEKYAELERVLGLLAPQTRVSAIGIGAAYPLGHFEIPQPEPLNNKVRGIWERFERISCRDLLAFNILRGLGVTCTLEACPSMKAFPHCAIPANGGDILVVMYNPFTGLAKDALPPGYGEWFRHLMDGWLKQATRVVGVMAEDIALAREWGYKAELIESTDALYQAIRMAKQVLSGRVHAAIPAMAMGRKVELLAVDSRYLTAEMLGINCHKP